MSNGFFIYMVRLGGLEPPRPKALPPQGSVSTNSTTTALSKLSFWVLNLLIYMRRINRLTGLAIC